MIINSIDTKDISFVVQGAVDKVYTKLCLESIRKNFPGSSIILSTWEGTQIDGLDFDELVLSRDCGAVICDFHTVPNNINRQFLSSSAGLKRVKTLYAAKVRSDLFFDSPSFLQYFNSFPCYDEKYTRVRSRIVALSLYSRYCYINYDTTKVNLAAFHISDWFLFGYTEDILKYFSAPPITDLSEFSRYYLDKMELHQYLPYPHLMLKLTPEQYLLSNFLGREDDDIIKLCTYDINENRRYLFNNFIILNYDKSHISNLKWNDISRNEWLLHPFEVCTLIFFAEFQYYYRKFCDPEYVFPIEDYKMVRRRKIRILKEVLWRDKIWEHYWSFLGKLKERFSFVKKIFRWISPAYRVGYGTRDILLHMQEEERASLNYLHYKVDNLSKELEEKSKEIKKLNKQLAAIMKEDEDELC